MAREEDFLPTFSTGEPVDAQPRALLIGSAALIGIYLLASPFCQIYRGRSHD